MSYERHPCELCGRPISAQGRPRHMKAHRGEWMRWYSPDEIAEAVRLYRRGQSLSQIAEQLHYSATTVGRMLRDADEPRVFGRTGRREPALSVEERLRTAELYGRGLTMREVGEIVGITTTSVRMRLLRYGVSIRSRSDAVTLHRRNAPLMLPVGVAPVAERYLAGATQSAIAAEFGITRDSVRRRLGRAGVKLRTRSEARRAHLAASAPARAA